MNRDKVITLAHGSGGKKMRDLIEGVIGPAFSNPNLNVHEDQARLPLNELLSKGDRLAFTTDSYVITPLFFPGGDIGSLAVHGTVNDLAVSGAIPLYLSCGLVIEEGFDLITLGRVLEKMAAAAQNCGVQVVTGDTKVVPRGAADGLFINTSGIGVLPSHLHPSALALREGDVIISSGTLGDHGAAVVLARGQLDLSAAVESDSQSIVDLVQAVIAQVPVVAMRDPTRGGLAAVLSEWAEASRVNISICMPDLPISPSVRSLCEVLGFDAVHLANEGKVILAVKPEHEALTLEILHAHPKGKSAAAIGRVRAAPSGLVTMRTGFGTETVLTLPAGEQLPRIC
ncbi:MAG: hydrogenase expression/formation protein HypE [Polyangiaceae bacterium]|nr:hydrogenase expression/formation protein HypE [Polyangiaceae bacterium]